MPIAAPLPILGILHKPALHRVAVHIAQLLDTLFFCEYVEVVVTPLPERPFSSLHGNGKLKSLQRACECSLQWLADKQVHVLGHDNIARDNEVIAETDSLKRPFKEFPGRRRSKVRRTVIAGEGDKVKITSLLIPYQSTRHNGQSYAAVSHISLEMWGTQSRM